MKRKFVASLALFLLLASYSFAEQQSGSSNPDHDTNIGPTGDPEPSDERDSIIINTSSYNDDVCPWWHLFC